MADVKLPGVGPVSKKWLIIVLGGSAATVGYIVIRKRSQASAASSAADTSGTDTSGSDIDPLTGDVAGSAQDQADLAAMQAGGGYDSGLGLDGLGDYGGEVSPVPVGTQLPGAGGFTTNGEWAQQAETDLGGLGLDAATLSAALGAYLTGRSLTSDQQSLVDQAIAEEGYPPVAGAGGYPPAMRTGGGGSGGGGASKPAAPVLQAPTVTATSATVRWGKVTGASTYVVQRSGHAQAGVGTATEHTFGGLKAGTAYTYKVWAKNSAGTGPAASGKFNTTPGPVKTHK